jgi:tetratricopeptide (TPR) repeat protein
MRWVGAIAVAVTVLAAGAWLSHERFDAVAAPALDAQGDSVAAEPPIAVGSAVPPAIEHALPPAPEPGAGADDIEPIADDSKSDSEGNEEDDAERSPEREIASDKADARLLAGRAREARALGDLAQAERLFERALENRARHVGALTGLAELALDRGDHRAAIGYLTRAVKVTPRSSDLRIRLGDAHYKLGELGPARSQYKKAAELGHRSAELRLARVDSAVAESSS